MNLKKIPLNKLSASAQPRPLMTAEVDKLAASIKEVGLIQPITVLPCLAIAGIAEQGWQIVAGHHRVAACRALGWTEIDAMVIDDKGHLQSELIEIDENLCRAELSASQRTSYTKRRKQIWEALHPEEKQVCQVGTSVAKHGHAQEKGFVAATAASTGQAERTTYRAIARAEAIGDEALTKVANTSLDSGVELDALAKLPEPVRSELIERAASGEKVSARPAKQATEPVSKMEAATPAQAFVLALSASVACLCDATGCACIGDVVEAINNLPELDEKHQTLLDKALDDLRFVAGLGGLTA